MNMNKTLSIGICALIALCSSSGCESALKVIKPDENAITRVLMIGNSFSISCMRHLPMVAKDCGVKLDIASLYIGGSSMKQHWQNAADEIDQKEKRPYTLLRITDGERTIDHARAKLIETLCMAQWDIVTIQQASHESWKSETYHPYGDHLVELIRLKAPQAKIVVQETWSYTPWDKRLAKWGIDQNQMYDKLKAAYRDFAAEYNLDVIRMGTAIQAWRRRLPVKYTERSFGGDVVGGGNQREEDRFRRKIGGGGWEANCDVSHLNVKGEYFQALVWAATLLHADFKDMHYRPACVSASEDELMRTIAREMETKR